MVARKNTTPAQIINHLRKAEVELANGKMIREVCKGLGLSEHTYYRWRRKYGGMNTNQAKRLKDPSRTSAFESGLHSRYWRYSQPVVALRLMTRHYISMISCGSPVCQE